MDGVPAGMDHAQQEVLLAASLQQIDCLIGGAALLKSKKRATEGCVDGNNGKAMADEDG